jgi:RNA polymerase sigma factor (sigma-70 family)
VSTLVISQLYPPGMAMKLLPRHPANDDALTAQALAGDGRAWGELVKRHDRAVRLALLARRIAPDEAREYAQEAWTRLLERERRGELGELRLPGLAIAQAIFIALDAQRRAARAPVSLQTTATELEQADSSASAVETLLGRQRLERARSTLRTMSATTQAVFRAVFEGPPVTYAEVATRLGLSEQRVKQTVCEIRATIRAALEQDDA